jgi:hypothetical protein
MRNLLVILALLISNLLYADSHIMFEKANQLYHNKMYDSAANLYSQMMQDGYQHEDLYYNAGNAYYRSNQIGLSIWCYRKAQQFGTTQNLEDNLALAQRRIKQPILASPKIFFIRWWEAICSLFSLNGWSILALFSFCLGMFFLFVKKIKQKQVVRNGIVSIFFIVSFISICFLAINYVYENYRYHGILIGKDIEFKSTLKTKFSLLSEGIEVEYRGKSKNGILIELPDGRVGEIDESAFKRI